MHRSARAARGAAPRDRGASRLAQLAVGLVVYGVSEALMLAPAVGVDPWDVFHTGLSRITGIPVGTVLIVVGAAVMLLWIPLRQRPGIGTIANIVVIGLVVDLLLAVMPAPHAFWPRWTMFVGGVALNAVATGLYIGAGLGTGPRDGLMTGLAAPGRSIRVVRTGIELSILAVGWLLGGNVGVGTVIYAGAIGPLVHVTIPWFARREPGRTVPLCPVPAHGTGAAHEYPEELCETPVAAA
ncbi:MAG: YczE/YyaS/YitT family protein [Actinocrinis sp.]